MEIRDGLQICYDEDIAVVDSGCDQCIINKKSFIIKSYSGVYYSITGALACMTSGTTLELVSEAYTMLVCSDGYTALVRLNQVLLNRDPGQTEALFQPHQLRAGGVLVDDVPTCHTASDGKPGTQCVQVGDRKLPLYFDGYKTYFRLARPSEEDLQSVPVYRLTSELPYEPQRRKYTRRVRSDIQLIQTILCSRKGKVDKTIPEWQANLGYPSVRTVKSTLRNTTHYVKTLEMETREYMRDYRKSRASPLRPTRIDDTLFTDTFYSTKKSIRGHTCFQLFALKKCMFSVATPMKTESNAYEVYTDFIISVGAPNMCVSDDARVYTSKRWKDINR